MNVQNFKELKSSGNKISMVTCYDFWSAKILNETKIDCLLVGDSLAMVMHGHETTLPATVEIMALHVSSVYRGAKSKFIIGDMPFLSFRKGLEPAMDAVEKIMVAGAQAVKLEGVWGHEGIIESIVNSGVPVMGHIGLTPQSVHQFGGYKVQGKSEQAIENLILQAKKLEDLGCFSIVLECMPSRVAERITKSISIPTIGIGAGAQVDGQVLVLHDLLGLNADFKPKFVRRFASGQNLIKEAIDGFCKSVNDESFPSEEESYL